MSLEPKVPVSEQEEENLNKLLEDKCAALTAQVQEQQVEIDRLHAEV